MDKLEFKNEFNRLSNKFNTNYQNRYDEDTALLFWAEIQMLKISWFRFQVNLSIGDMKPLTLSALRDAAIKMRNQIKQEQELKLINDSHNNTDRKNGLNKILKRMGVNSLNEAIKQKRVMNNFNTGDGGEDEAT